MKKSILTIGKALDKREQKLVQGGNEVVCSYAGQSCGRNQFCCEDPFLWPVLVCMTFEECLAGPGI